jgi:hypothetical protein
MRGWETSVIDGNKNFFYID